MKRWGLLIAFLALASSVSSQSFSQRQLTVTQTEYDLFKTSDIDVRCSDYLCQEPSFTITETMRPWFNQTMWVEYSQLNYEKFCVLLQEQLSNKDAITDSEYPEYKDQVDAFLKEDCSTYWSKLKERFDAEVFAVPAITSGKGVLTIGSYPTKAIANVDDISKTITTTTTTLKEVTTTTIKSDSETIDLSEYTPNTATWSGKIQLENNQGIINMGGYTNNYNIQVNFSNNKTSCNATLYDLFKISGIENTHDTSCAVILNQNSSYVSATLNITSYVLGNSSGIAYDNFNSTDLSKTSLYSYGMFGEFSQDNENYFKNFTFLYKPYFNTMSDFFKIILYRYGTPELYDCNINMTVCNVSCSDDIGYGLEKCLDTPTYLSTTNVSTLNTTASSVSGYPFLHSYHFHMNNNYSFTKNGCYQVSFFEYGTCNNSDTGLDSYKPLLSNLVSNNFQKVTSTWDSVKTYYWQRSIQSAFLSLNSSSYNISLDVGSDGIVDWNSTSLTSVNISIADAITNCTKNISLCSGYYCSCPLDVVADTAGIILFSDLNVTYNTPPLAVNISITNAPLVAGNTPPLRLRLLGL